MHILLGLIIFIIALYAANVSRDADTFGWVILGSIVAIPVGALVLHGFARLLGRLFSRSENR